MLNFKVINLYSDDDWRLDYHLFQYNIDYCTTIAPRIKPWFIKTSKFMAISWLGLVLSFKF